MFPKNKAVQAGLLYYLLNNFDFHNQKQNSGMHSIYDMSFHYNHFQVTVVIQKYTPSTMRYRAKKEGL